MIELQIPNQIFQTDLLSDWDRVEKKIEQSKILRFPYKSMLGMSLTAFITKWKKEGLEHYGILANLMAEEGVKNYRKKNPHLIEKLYDNARTSISARLSEQKALANRIRC